MSLDVHFLLILAGVALEFVAGGGAAWRTTRWSFEWLAWVERVCGAWEAWRGPLAVATIVGLPVLAVLVASVLLHDFSALLGHAFALGVFVLMLGPEDLAAEVAHHRQLLDGAGAGGRRPQYLHEAEAVELGAHRGDADFDAGRAELAALALAAMRAWYLPVFWFLVAGPVGAVACRLVSNLRRAEGLDDDAMGVLANLREALDYLPVRLTALALGLAGTLVPVLDAAREVGFLRWGRSRELLARAALAATDYGRVHEVIGGEPRLYRLNQMLALLRRALVVWLLVAAVVALAA
jgi:AmpE protein